VDEREGHVFVNNLLVATGEFTKTLLRFEQTPSLCDRLTNPAAAQLDYNVFVRTTTMPDHPLIVWAPGKGGEDCNVELASPAELHAQHPQFFQHADFLDGYMGPLFRSLALQHYELQSGFPVARVATELPDNIRALLGWSKDAKPFVGAYAPTE